MAGPLRTAEARWGEPIPRGEGSAREQGGSPGGAHAGDILKILHQDRDARERAGIAARGNLSVKLLGLLECEITPKGDNGVQRAIETRDALKRPFDELMRRNAARPHRVGKRAENCLPPAEPIGNYLSERKGYWLADNRRGPRA